LHTTIISMNIVHYKIILYKSKDSILPIGTLATDIHCKSTSILSQAIIVNHYTSTELRTNNITDKLLVIQIQCLTVGQVLEIYIRFRASPVLSLQCK